ncbi:Uncharacterised protein [uncultured Comamonas sp.]|nr:Uncharacterised protein [uncultured Comamonas sp.]
MAASQAIKAKSIQKPLARGFGPGVMPMRQQPGPGLGFRPGAMAQDAQQPAAGLGFNPGAMAQAQALNQQPDSIPAMMKPGEYVLPPDTVAAMGGPGALDAAVAQTHTPGNEQAVVPRGFGPRMFFANGGLVAPDDEQRKPGSVGLSGGAAPASTPAMAPAAAPTPRAQFVADQNAKLATANAGLAERTQQMNARYRPAPNSTTNTFPGNRLPGASGAASVLPAASGAAPAQPSRGVVGFLADTFPGTTAAVQGSMDDAKEAYRRGGVGAALGQSARSAATPLIGLADDVYSSAAKVVRPVADTALQAGKTFLTGDVSSINPLQQGAVAGPETSPGATPQTQSLVNAEEMQRRAAAQAVPTQPQVRGLPGVYQHGPGQYSDNAQGMGFAPGFTGQPSAQNMQAANALAGQQQAQSLGRVAAQQQAQQQEAVQQPRGFAAPQISHSGNDFTARQNLRGLKMDAEWAMQRAPRKKYAMQDPAVMAYQAALQGDMAARYGGQAALEAKTNDTNAGLQREQMQQQGANQRDAGRLALEQQRAGMDAQVRGFDVRTAQRRENAQEAWQKATPEQRSVMREMYPDLFGSKEAKPFQLDVVRGSVDPATGKRDGDYAVVFDPNTGLYRPMQIGGEAAVPTAAPQEVSKRVIGQTYTMPNGKNGTWTANGWVLAD